MDPDIMSVLNDKENEMNSPNPDYYPSLLKNCEFVVGGIQSMMIESAIFGKIFMAMVHNDYENISSMHNVLRRYKHFEGIGNIESMIFCDNINDLENKFSQSLEKKNNFYLEKLTKRKYILYSDEKTYQVRLTELINQVIN